MHGESDRKPAMPRRSQLPSVPTGVMGLNGKAQLGNQFKTLIWLTFLVSGLRISHAESALLTRQYRG
jgi:hypothetical protein